MPGLCAAGAAGESVRARPISGSAREVVGDFVEPAVGVRLDAQGGHSA
jgi:hypothetical protein